MRVLTLLSLFASTPLLAQSTCPAFNYLGAAETAIFVTNRAGGSQDNHEHTLKAGHDNAPRLVKVLQALFEGLV